MRFTSSFGQKLQALLIVTILLVGCKDEIAQEADCSCLLRIVSGIEQLSCEGDARIESYRFQGEIVYYVDPGFCAADQGYAVLDHLCEEIGVLGTIAGITEINGVNFWQHAELLEVVWQRE